MAFRSWFNFAPSPRRSSRRDVLRHKPRVEALEDRFLPSVYSVTNANDAGLGSLRQAILDANSNSGSNVIDFDFAGSGVDTIFVGITTGMPLPAITSPVAIDGYSQPGTSVNTLSVGDNAVLRIGLDGSDLGPGFNGLHITAGNTTVRGLMIDNFTPTTGASPVGGNAILMDTSGGNVIEGNFLGLHGSGGAGTFSNFSDVAVGAGSGNNRIGGTTPDTRNVISGANEGVDIALNSGSGNLVQGNQVGTDPSGTFAVPNFDGLADAGTGNTIGGTVSSARNVFSGNGRSGVALGFAVNDVVEGNLIGVTAQGTARLSNASFGILAAAGSGDTIGGTAPGAGNVIGGLSGDGIEIEDSGAPAGTNGFSVEGNFLGTDPTGQDNFGNATGILIEGNAVTQGVANTTVSGNVINNESLVGVEIDGVAAKDNVVQGNFIGTDPTGTLARGNGVGVEVAGGAHNNVIGGTASGQGNVIAHNTGAGVVIGASIKDTTTVGNSVRGNSIYGNGGIGIDLGNRHVRRNVLRDPSPGPNNLQNFPVLAGVHSRQDGQTLVTGKIHSAPNATITLDFYASAAAASSGFTEGQRYLGTAVVTTDANGNAQFVVELSAATTAGELVTATATDSAGDTSEFSAARKVLA
jgi:titin